MPDRVTKATILKEGRQCCKSLTALEQEYKAEIVILVNQQKMLRKRFPFSRGTAKLLIIIFIHSVFFHVQKSGIFFLKYLFNFTLLKVTKKFINCFISLLQGK